jgi:hypothetical protein
VARTTILGAHRPGGKHALHRRVWTAWGAEWTGATLGNLQRMSVEELEMVLKRAGTEPGFGAMIGADPHRMTQYDLEPREIAALLNQDVDGLIDMGVDEELAGHASFIGRLTG